MSQALAGTTEFMALYGTTSATQIATTALVTAMCEGIFGIPPGPGALLNVGLPVWEVLQNFAQSSKFIGDTSTSIVGFQNALLAGETPTGSLFDFSPTGTPGVTYTLTTGVDTNASLGAPASGIPTGSTVNGVINSTSGVFDSTLNPGDNLLFAGGTLKVVDVQNLGSNELAGVTLTGPFKFVVTEEASYGTFDFSLNPGATQVTSLNSQDYVYFTGLAAGTVVEMSGASSNADIYSGFSDPTTPVTLQFDGGVKGESIYNYYDGDAPTTVTLLSTGAANGSINQSDFAQFTDYSYSVTSLTIAASTNLYADLYIEDYSTSGVALVVKDGVLAAGASPATLVNLLDSSTGIQFKTVDASGLSAGSLQMYGDSSLTTFTGGHGTANELLWDGSSSDFLSSATAINGGSTDASISPSDMGNVLSAGFVGATNASVFTNWQTLDVTNMYTAGVDQGFATPGQLDTALMTANGPISGLQFTGGDSNVETLLNVAPATTILVTNPNGGSVYDAGLTLTHSSATGDSLSVNLTNTDTTGSSYLELYHLTSTGDTSIAINASGGGSGSDAYLEYIYETDNNLATVTVTGNTYFENYGIHTDTGVAAAATATTIASSLTTIDASATTNGVYILAGDNDTPSANNTVTYTGLAIKGGSGADDFLYDGANSGVITDGNGKGDGEALGGSSASATVGTGANDYSYVGYDEQAGTPSLQGASVGDSFTFGAGATATAWVYNGANSYSGPGDRYRDQRDDRRHSDRSAWRGGRNDDQLQCRGQYEQSCPLHAHRRRYDVRTDREPCDCGFGRAAGRGGVHLRQR